MKMKERAEKRMLAVTCPTCGAEKNKPCELASGKRRTDPHRERQWAASDKRIIDAAERISNGRAGSRLTSHSCICAAHEIFKIGRNFAKAGDSEASFPQKNNSAVSGGFNGVEERSNTGATPIAV
jgi:hypothetical protein